MRRAFCAVLLLAFASHAFSQSKQTPAKTTPPPSAVAPKAAVVQPKYLKDNLDLTTTNLGPNFAGHDILAVFAAIKESTALAPKSEFESTPEYSARRNKFASSVLFGNVVPTGYLGFVDEDSRIFGPQYTYDADSQTLAITVVGTSESFIVDNGISRIGGIQIRRVLLDNDSYVGGNAFGAKVDVQKTYWQEYGLAFDDSSLFQYSGGQSRKFTYLLKISPDEASTLKANAKLLIVCRMSDPWFYHGAHGHDPTISEPYETLIGDNYLRATPEQIWVFDQRTGEIIQKISEASLTAYQDQQMSLRLKETPLFLEVYAPRTAAYTVVIDDKPEESGNLSSETRTIAAKHRIVFTSKFPQDLSDLMFKLNGKLYIPSWTKDATQIGSYESIRSATFEIKVP